MDNGESVPKAVRDLVVTSGNNFHAKVARRLIGEKWRVVVSPYYLDQTAGKAREIDLIATKLWPLRSRHDQYIGEIAVRLFIECKYVAGPSVFWFADKDVGAAMDLVTSSGPFRRDNVYTEKHHYLSQSPKVAKLFASSASKTVENEPFYKALNQVLNSMVALRGKSVINPKVDGPPGSSPKVTLNFPIVICSSFGQIYAVDFYNEEPPALVENNFQLEVQYAYVDRHQHQQDDYFLVDLVKYDQIDEFLRAIDEDERVCAQFAG
jgi:hypothetical protein